MKDQPLLRVIAQGNIPLMVVYGLYVQTHGELGPGGGFQAGVIIAAGFILYGLVFGVHEMRRIVPRWFTDVLAAVGVMLYAGVGVYSAINGYEFLDHTAIMPSNPGGAEPWGMVLVEWGVGFTVTAVMITIFNEVTEGTTEETAADDDSADAERNANIGYKGEL
ncbi:Na(+)/H(+) antiporter subunit B [Planctomycetota bacterium]|nr:Na(+)/H(+) antiporter subunit B [Planctomycetota bacterium]